jgi:hypothetical protein
MDPLVKPEDDEVGGLRMTEKSLGYRLKGKSEVTIHPRSQIGLPLPRTRTRRAGLPEDGRGIPRNLSDRYFGQA